MKPLNDATAKLLDVMTADLDDPCDPNAVTSRRRYDNASGFMAAVVERIGPHRYSVAHYYEQNGDLIADPDLELVRNASGVWYPVAVTHPPPFGHRRAVECDASDAPVRWNARAYADLRSFAVTFLRNVKRQQGIKIPRPPKPPSTEAAPERDAPAVVGEIVAPVKIGRVEYKVERRAPTRPEVEGTRPVYVLRGPKGAAYRTMRNYRDPEQMFLLNCRSFGVALGDTWLTDRNGALEVMR
jgi:hypothetical protein